MAISSLWLRGLRSGWPGESALQLVTTATDGDRHANDDDDECDQLNRTNDHEPDDNMSHDDDDNDDIDVNDHNDKDDDDDAEQVLIGGDDPVYKSCGNFGHRSHRDHKCPNHHCAHCHKQGHTKRFCPDVQCPHCNGNATCLVT